MPKFLYLVRHAKSSWKDASLSDRERPLNGRGRRSAPEMGGRLATGGHSPDLIISSPARRAFSTAKKIAKELLTHLGDPLGSAQILEQALKARVDGHRAASHRRPVAARLEILFQ